MQVIVGFGGRGVDTLGPESFEGAEGADWADRVVHNLIEGIGTGRVLWFTVIGSSIDAKTAALALKQHDESA